MQQLRHQHWIGGSYIDLCPTSFVSEREWAIGGSNEYMRLDHVTCEQQGIPIHTTNILYTPAWLSSNVSRIECVAPYSLSEFKLNSSQHDSSYNHNHKRQNAFSAMAHSAVY